jgi:hypothetical protein
LKESIPAYPDGRCNNCDHFCLDPFTETPFDDCNMKQSVDNIAMLLSFKGLLPRPLLNPVDEDDKKT